MRDPLWVQIATEPEAEEAGAGAGLAVEVRGLRRDYDDRPVLRDVSIELGAGRTLTVLGPNGAGKTTLLRILATLLRPTAGRVRVLGAELPRRAPTVRGRIGYLGHQPLLYRELTVRENLEFNARLLGIEDPGRRIDELLDRAGLTRREGQLVRNLSAGTLQRAAVCRTLLGDPELLLLDEPRSHLDLGAIEAVEAMLAATPRRARVLVTHDAEHGLAVADRALVLGSSGTVSYAGPAADLAPADARALLEGSGG